MVPIQAQVLEFARDLILQLDFGPNAARVGLVEFDETATILSNLTHNVDAVLATLASATAAAGWTSISSGLSAGLNVLRAGGGSGMRPKVLLVLTDGEQSQQFGGAALAIAHAAEVRAAGVEIFGVGFGGANPATIAAISSAPASHYAYTGIGMAAIRDHFRGRFCSLFFSPRAPPPPPPAPPSRRAPIRLLSSADSPGGGSNAAVRQLHRRLRRAQRGSTTAPGR